MKLTLLLSLLLISISTCFADEIKDIPTKPKNELTEEELCLNINDTDEFVNLDPKSTDKPPICPNRKEKLAQKPTKTLIKD